jgi:hypothetical protein
MPLGNVDMMVKRSDAAPPLPLNRINQLEEGDRIEYRPVLRANEKRRGEIALVLVRATPAADTKENFAVLESKDADKPTQWTVPFTSSLAVYVYGPSGLSTRKIKGFLEKDQELITQLADYAEKTAQTEAVMQALATFDSEGRSENLNAALQGFAGQYGSTNKIDRTAPLDQQTLAALRTLNPALSAYDPIAPAGSQRLAQSAGLATTVAAMFFGSTVGLAAGSTAMALNLKTILFPDTDFRSAYAQPSKTVGVTLCSNRETVQTRKRLAYLWALRVPSSGPPPLRIDGPNHIPVGLRTAVPVGADEGRWKLAARARDWALRGEDSKSVAVPVTVLPDQKSLELNLAGLSVPPGKYTLRALWDWQTFDIDGEVFVEPLGSFDHARLAPESQNRLRAGSGKQVVTMEDGDFQFLDKAEIVRKGDRYATPAVVPFTLPMGQRRGRQSNLEMQVDTGSLAPGDYNLLLSQQGGQKQAVEVKVLPDPPKLANLPLTIHAGESNPLVVFEGEGLDRITSVGADGLQFELEPSEDNGRRRAARVHGTDKLTANSKLELRISVRDYAQPLTIAEAIRVLGPRPKIVSANASLPADLPVALRQQELPAGFFVGVMVRVRPVGTDPAFRFACRNVKGREVRVASGTESDRVKVRPMQADGYFLSFDPGLWPGGCALTAVLDSKDSGASDAFDLGRVVRLPQIESFQLTDEAAGEGSYYGIVTGRDLELIEKTGWDASNGHAVEGLPAPVAGEGDKQSLKVRLPWPSPAPHAPLFIWFRGEAEGRSTKARS